MPCRSLDSGTSLEVSVVFPEGTLQHLPTTTACTFQTRYEDTEAPEILTVTSGTVAAYGIADTASQPSATSRERDTVITFTFSEKVCSAAEQRATVCKYCMTLFLLGTTSRSCNHACLTLAVLPTGSGWRGGHYAARPARGGNPGSSFCYGSYCECS